MQPVCSDITAVLAGCGTLFTILVLVIVVLSVCLCRQSERFVVILYNSIGIVHSFQRYM